MTSVRAKYYRNREPDHDINNLNKLHYFSIDYILIPKTIHNFIHTFWGKLGVSTKTNIPYDARMDLDTLKQRLSDNGLQVRQAQMDMLAAIQNTLSKQSILCVEAPTGTGKTLAYGLGALLARKPKQHIIISTATVALQTQLIEKDLPQIQTLLNQDLSVAMAKGRRRYVCPARLFDTEDTQSDLLDKPFDVEPLKEVLSNNQWNGDRDTLSTVVPHPAWQRISTDAAGCSGRHCAYFEDCPFFKAKRQQTRADVIVANHSLLLADLQLGGGVILPSPDKCIYIIDECHHLPEQAISHFSNQASVMGSIDWINQFTKTISSATKLGELNDNMPNVIQPLTHTLVTSLKAMHDTLESHHEDFIQDTWQPDESALDLLLPQATDIVESSKHVFQHAAQLTQQLEDKITDREKQKLPANEELNRLHRQLSFVTGRADTLLQTWQAFCHQRQPKESPIAKWFTHSKEYHCHTAPINVSTTLNTHLWSQCQLGAICCSATIQSLGKFDDFLRRSGLKQKQHCQTIALPSHFDYSQSVLFVPTMTFAPQGKAQADHHKESLKLIQQLILPTGGTLVLFTSIRAMDKMYDDIPDALALDVLVQTHHSKSELIKRHQAAIAAGKRSVLFGLASLGEGLDLPDNLCQHVIIHKLPFAVPTTPIERTRNDWLVAHNKNPFMLSTLPHASLKLTQYVGRLIRRDTDSGVITILDKRLYTKPYGQHIISHLPPFVRIINQPVSALKQHAHHLCEQTQEKIT